MTGRRVGGAVLAMAVLAGCSGSSEPAAPSPGSGASSGASSGPAPSGSAGGLQVTSSAFPAGATIPSQFTCRGVGDAPPLAWAAAAADAAGSAAAFGLLVDDPDAPGGTFVHWVVLDLPAGTSSLPQGGQLPTGATQARNSTGGAGWQPPCPPSGTHHYRFTVYALSAPTGLANGVDQAEAIAALDRLAIARGQLVGLVSSG
jgi:Raf kinase inhibitor-like YbhB/YbcL family protein